MANNSAYKVGYKKPPRDSQFKKGQSGNPKGRPKDARNLSTLFDDVMLEEIEYTENGKKRRRTAFEVILLRLRQRALTDDSRAAEMILRHFQQFGMSRSEPKPIEELLDDDKAILEDFTEHTVAAAGPATAPKGQGGAA